jgi:hypothetical protein
MKLIKNLKFAALAALSALAVTLLFQTSITWAGDKGKKGDHGQRGGDNEKGDRDHRDAKVTFSKWVVALPNLPGLIANMEGLGDGGAAGEGIFTGEVLKWDTSGPSVDIVAVYHFTGSKHAFTAVVHVTQPKTSPDGVIVGVVTDGWLKGHALKGSYTVISVGPNPFGADLPVPYIPVTLEIDRDSDE